MGIMFSRQSGNPKFNKFKQIGGLAGQKILKKMDYTDRTKLKGLVKGIGGRKMSIQQAAKLIGEEHGSRIKKKFLTAAEKHYSGGLTEKQKERNIKSTMATDTSVLDEERNYGQSKASVLGRVGSGVKGTAANRFGLKAANTGFALQRKSNVSSPNPASPPRTGGGGGTRISLAG